MDDYVIFERTAFDDLSSKLELITEHIRNNWSIYSDQKKYYDKDRKILITEDEYNDIKQMYERASKKTLSDRQYAGSTLIEFYSTSIKTSLQIREEISKFLSSCDGYIKYNIYIDFCEYILGKHPFARDFGVTIQSRSLSDDEVKEIVNNLNGGDNNKLFENIRTFFNIPQHFDDITNQNIRIDNAINSKLKDNVRNPFDNDYYWDNKRIHNKMKETINEFWDEELQYLNYFCVAQNCFCEENTNTSSDKHITSDKLELIFEILTSFVVIDESSLNLDSKYTCNNSIAEIIDLVQSS